MTARRRWLIAIAVASLFGMGPLLAKPTQAVPQWNMQIWMLPPAAPVGTNACLRRGFHSTDPNYEYMRAIDWAMDCPANTGEGVRFRAIGVDPDDLCGADCTTMTGEVQQLTPSKCPHPGGGYLGTVTIGKVTIWSIYGTSLAGMIYAHTDVFSGSTFNIRAQGASVSSGYLNSIGIGDTVDDYDAPDCFTGYHIHETNVANDGFDYWNTGKYSEPGPSHCDCYLNTSSANWTRRMNWILYGAE